MEPEHAVHVNFARPMPVFPLDQVALLPQQILPLHIFEPRYKDMVSDALDGAGQIAMATFRGDRWRTDYHGRPPVRPAVCIGQIVQHESLDDGRYNILLQGVCRARIRDEIEPDAGRLYRLAVLEPVGADTDDEALDPVRERVETLLEEGELSRLAAADTLLEYVRNDDVPTSALLEVISFALVTDARVRYRLLAEPDPARRAETVMTELRRLRSLLERAADQHPEAWPKGVSWN